MAQPRWVAAFPKDTREQIRLLAELCECSPREVVINAVKKMAAETFSKRAAWGRLTK